jgi:predicted HicB family RNase H-like nuclease
MKEANREKALKELMDRKYSIEISHIKEEDDSYFMAFFTELGWSTCSAVGDTPQEALEELDKVKREVFTYFLEKGKPLPKPLKSHVIDNSLQQTPIRIPKEMHRQLKNLAREEGSSLNTYLIKVLNEHLTLRTTETKIAHMLSKVERRLDGILSNNSDLYWFTSSMGSTAMISGELFGLTAAEEDMPSHDPKNIPLHRRQQNPPKLLGDLANILPAWNMTR